MLNPKGNSSKFQAYNDAYLSSGYNKPARKDSIPEGGGCSSGGFDKPTRNKSIHEYYVINIFGYN